MYVRGCVERVGRHTSVPGPAPKRRDVCQTEDVPVLPARSMFVATASMLTRAGRGSRKWTNAASRNPSPFGLTVVSSRRSPANGTDPFVTWRPWRPGARARAATPAAAVARERGLNDGTLSVKDAHGMVTIQGRGAVIGSFAKGSVTISDPIENDGTGPIVTGDEWSKDRSDTTTTWGGTRVRFRDLGGAFRMVGRD